MFAVLLRVPDAQAQHNCIHLSHHQMVRCSGEDVTNIPNDLPKDTNMLQLHNTEITNFSLDDTIDLPNLRQVYIYNSPITHIYVARKFDKLDILNVKNTKLKRLDNVKIEAPNLRQVYLDNSLLSESSSSTSTSSTNKNTTIITLSLRGNKFQSFDSSQIHLKSSRLLLDDNPIQKLNLSSGFQQLSTLSLKNTSLNVLDASVINLPSLSSLYLDDNHFHQLNLIAYFTRLSLLSLKNVTLQSGSISHKLGLIKNLRYLYLDHTSLQHFNLTEMRSLTTLSLKENGITCLDDSVVAAPKLSELYLNNNDLQSIDISKFPKLVKLDLSGNRNLSKITFNWKSPPNISTIVIEDKALHCDCCWLRLISNQKQTPRVCKQSDGSAIAQDVSSRLNCSQSSSDIINICNTVNRTLCSVGNQSPPPPTSAAFTPSFTVTTTSTRSTSGKSIFM